MLAVELEPAPFPCRRDPVVVPRGMPASFIERRGIAQRLEFNGLLDRKTDENTTSVLVDEITPRQLARRLESLAKKPSTALSHEDEVGVKWKVKRGWRSSHLRTFGCLWVA